MENSKAKNVIIIVLIVLLLCCLGFIIWQSFEINDKTPEKGNDTEKQETEEGLIQMDINSELIKELYEFVPRELSIYNVNNESDVTNAYQDKKITMNDLQKYYILGVAYGHLDIEESDKVDFLYEDGTSEGRDDWFGFRPELLQTKVKEIFGKNVDNDSFGLVCSGPVTYDGKQYNVSYGGGCSCFWADCLNKMSKAYKQGDELYIEDKFILVNSDCANCNDNEEDCVTTKLYTSSNKTNKIAQITENYEDYSESTATAENTILETLFTKYENVAQRYKHTFKLGEDNKYYWYSTEPIN